MAETSELQIEKVIYGGDGLARQEGRVVFVPYTLPGERVRAAVDQRKRDLWTGKLEGVLEPSAQRTLPPCPYFGHCGGCQLQHGTYEHQVELKREMLLDQLLRLGGIRWDGPVATLAAEPLHYRNRVQLHFRNRQLGYLAKGSHELVAIDHCPISSPKLNEVIGVLRRLVKDPRWPDFLVTAELFTNERDVQFNVMQSDRGIARRFFEWCAQEIPGFRDGALPYEAAGFTFRVSGSSFFQVNRFLVDALVAEVVPDEALSLALDLYAGAGLFSLPLAQQTALVTSVESNVSAADDLQHNAQAAGLNNVVPVSGSVEAHLEAWKEGAPDLVVADPPRAGLGTRVVDGLLRMMPRRLVIVSCDPSTLARDLRALTAGGFHIERLTLVDLFPQTAHLETIVHLTPSHPNQ